MDHSAMSPSVLVFERFFLKLTVMMGKASNDHSAELCYAMWSIWEYIGAGRLS